MAYTLGGSVIRKPMQMQETNSTQFAQNRTLSGAIARDYFGSNKRVWVLSYRTTQKADFDTINAIYLSYLSTGTVKSWVVTETNYAVSSTNVHIDIVERGFSIGGETYLSDFDLVLTES